MKDDGVKFVDFTDAPEVVYVTSAELHHAPVLRLILPAWVYWLIALAVVSFALHALGAATVLILEIIEQFATEMANV